MAAIAVIAALVAAAVAFAEWPTATGTRVGAGRLPPSVLAVAVSAASPPAPPGQPPPITFSSLFVRTTADGITIRAHLATITGPLPCPPGQACPGDLPHSIVHVGLSTDEVVGEMAVPGDGPPPTVLALVGPSGFGLPGVATGFALVFRAGAPVARVQMTFADGGSDAMAPLDGWAVLAHLGSSPFGTVEALDAHGHVLGSTSVPPGPPAAGPGPGPARGGPAVPRSPGGAS
jgi:hypothetical protein